MSPTAAQYARRSRSTPLPAAFYNRDTERVARDLIGAVLECRTAQGVAAGRIVETEAYLGPHDPACHAAAGLTRRNRSLFGPPGTSYVYFIYGMHWCVNAVTRARGHGSAVLIRALAPVTGLDLIRTRRWHARERDLTNGPAKLCEALGIDASFDGLRLDRGPIRILAGDAVEDDEIAVSQRIGITQAADWPLRFYVRNSPHVSRAPATPRKGAARAR